ncbi:MAG: MmgE/PrpD family protein [Betaproteobacteria bacterium]
MTQAAAIVQRTAVERLAQSVCAIQADAPMLAKAAVHLLDWLGCAAHGSTSPQGLVFARWLELQAQGYHPTLAGRSSDAAAAAAYHGALGSALEMDDVHRSSILHPGPVVIPAALAASGPETSGAHLLNGIARGYEAMIRVGRALGPSHYRYWHTTSTAGSFGAAAAAATVMHLGPDRTAQALAIAGTRSGGLWQVRHEPSMGKAWHTASAAREGLTAAQLASVGLTGPLGVLDGPSGWFAATAPKADVSMVDRARPTPWLDDMSIKPWPACRHAHPAMDAFRQAAAGRILKPALIQKVEVFSYADALRFCNQPLPVTEAQARFSIQHALAAWAQWGEPQLAHYHAQALCHPLVRALRKRISVTQDRSLELRYPQHYGARVCISWRDGTSSQALVHDTYGDPDQPLTDSALRAKARMLMEAAGWGQVRIEAAITVTEKLASATSLNALYKIIQP